MLCGLDLMTLSRLNKDWKRATANLNLEWKTFGHCSSHIRNEMVECFGERSTCTFDERIRLALGIMKCVRIVPQFHLRTVRYKTESKLVFFAVDCDETTSTSDQCNISKFIHSEVERQNGICREYPECMYGVHVVQMMLDSFHIHTVNCSMINSKLVQ